MGMKDFEIIYPRAVVYNKSSTLINYQHVECMILF